jgi:hypothetical protein
LRVQNGFVRGNAAQGLEAVELFDGTAVLAVVLRLVAEEQREAVMIVAHPADEALPELPVELLDRFAGGTGVEVFGEGFEEAGLLGFDIGQRCGEDTGFEAGGAKARLLREGDLLDGDELLGIGGLIEGDRIVPKAGEVVHVFEAADVVGGGESVADGILRGTGFAGVGAGSGGFAGVGTVGGELFLGEETFGHRIFHFSDSTPTGRRWTSAAGKWLRGGEIEILDFGDTGSQTNP